MAGKVRHLLNRLWRWYARLSVPAALRSTVGKRELTEALGADLKAAQRLLPRALAKMQATIQTARAVAGKPSAPRRVKQLNAQQLAIQHYADQMLFDDELRNSRPLFGLGGPDMNYVDVLRRAVTGSATDEELARSVGWIITKFQRQGSTSVQPGAGEWRTVARALATAELEFIKRTVERDEGDFSGTPSHPILTETSKPLAPDDPLVSRILGPDSLRPLSELVDGYIKERSITPSTAHERLAAVRLFEEFMGEPVPIYKIDRRGLIAFKNELLQAPAHYTQRFPGMTLPQATKANKERATPYDLLKPYTVNEKGIGCLGAVLAWAVRSGIIPDNPAIGLKATIAKATQPPRVSFDSNDLARIFAPARFASKPWGEMEWALLLALFTGARPSELAQVKLTSIKTERGVLVLRIEEATKTLGYLSAVSRFIPRFYRWALRI